MAIVNGSHDSVGGGFMIISNKKDKVAFFY
jgi:hypothetical protein